MTNKQVCLLSGKIYCGGAKYHYQKWRQRIICYCYSRQKSKPELIKYPNCNNIRLDKTQKKIKNLIQLLSDNIANEEVKCELAKKTFEKSNIIKELEDIKEKERVTKTYDKIKNLESVWTDMEFKEKRNIVEQLLDKIVVDGKILKIYWNVSEN